MRLVWFIFKIFESFLGITCLAIHVEGFLIVSVHEFFIYVVLFVLFPSVAMFGCLNICLDSSPTACYEATLNTSAAVSYIGIAITTMYYAEKEFYLMYLSELEEPLHPFFRYSKAQSIAALSAGVLHLMHSVLAFDILLVRASKRSATSLSDEDSTVTSARQPLKLYLMGKTVETKLEQYVWFRRLAGSSHPEDLV